MKLRQVPESLEKLVPVGATHVSFEASVCDVIRPKRSGRTHFKERLGRLGVSRTLS